MYIYVYIFAHLGTSGEASLSKRVPSTQRVTSTFPAESSGNTSGAVTAFNPRVACKTEGNVVILINLHLHKTKKQSPNTGARANNTLHK